MITSVRQSFDSFGPSSGAESKILLVVGGGWIKVFGIKSGGASRNRRDDAQGYLRIGLINCDVRIVES